MTLSHEDQLVIQAQSWMLTAECIERDNEKLRSVIEEVLDEVDPFIYPNVVRLLRQALGIDGEADGS